MNPYTLETLVAYAGLGILVLGFAAGLIGLRWLWRRTGGGSPVELAALRARVEELEGGREHLAELEERLEFTERMLARPEVKAVVSGEAR